MTSIKTATASAQALSTLSNSAKEVIIQIEEGQPVEVNVSDIAPATAATSNGIGVATKMILQTYSESLSASEKANAGGMALVRATTSRSGNTALISLVRETPSSHNYDNTRLEGTSGGHSIVVSSSRSPEKLYLSYDPVSLSHTTTTFLNGVSRFVYYPSTLPNFAALPATPLDAGLVSLLSSPEDLILLRFVDGALALVVKSGSTFDVNTAMIAASTLQPAHKALRFSSVDLKAGLGFTSVPSQPTYGYTAGCLPMTTTSAPKTDCVIDSSTTATSFGKWTAYLLSSAPDLTLVQDLFRVFFGKSYSTLVSNGVPEISTHEIKVGATYPVNPSTVSLVFNSKLIYSTGDHTSPDGGIMIG